MMAAHPNEVDLLRISRLLEQRQRYHYVAPSVQAVPSGYRIVSPCCSCNIDQAGGVIDIARIEFESNCWKLYRKDHANGQWLLHSQASRLDGLMHNLNQDADRVFWQ